jgi:transposase
MMAKKKVKVVKSARRTFTKEFKQEAIQLLLDGHSASSVATNLGIENTNLLYRWKNECVTQSGPIAETLDAEMRELRGELLRTQRERDILKKALSIFSRQE